MSRPTASRGIRIAVVSGAAVLCAGAAVPAIAHDTGSVSTQGDQQQLSFAQQQQIAQLSLDREASWLYGLKSRVADDSRLTAAQKAAFTAKLDQALAAVADARAAVGAASTPAQLAAAMQTAELPYLGYPQVLPEKLMRHHAHHKARHHRAGQRADVALLSTQASRPMEVHRSVTVRQAADPRWQGDWRRDGEHRSFSGDGSGGWCDHSGDLSGDGSGNFAGDHEGDRGQYDGGQYQGGHDGGSWD